MKSTLAKPEMGANPTDCAVSCGCILPAVATAGQIASALNPEMSETKTDAGARVLHA
jgi:hypothetical protein